MPNARNHNADTTFWLNFSVVASRAELVACRHCYFLRFAMGGRSLTFVDGVNLFPGSASGPPVGIGRPLISSAPGGFLIRTRPLLSEEGGKMARYTAMLLSTGR